MKYDADKPRPGEAWVDDGEAMLTLAQRAEMRKRAKAVSARDMRRFREDDAPPAGTHYSEKTGHKLRGLADKNGSTSRARFDLTSEPDMFLPDSDYLPPDQYDPLGPVAPEAVEGFREHAVAAEDNAKKQWRKQVGSKQESGLGWTEHRREVAAQIPPTQPKPDIDAAALQQFHGAAKSGAIGFMKPPETGQWHSSRSDNTPYATRSDRKDARAAKLADGQGQARNSIRKQRDKDDTQPPQTRGRR